MIFNTFARPALFTALTIIGLSGIVAISQTMQELKPFDPPKKEPVVVTPGTKVGDPPSDAIVLFDGKDLSGWKTLKDGSDAKWNIKDGFMEVAPKSGDIATKQEFGDCQLHIEFATPAEVKGESQGRGNSGVFLMGHYELQVLDSYQNPTYFHGQAGSIYKQHAPLVNVSRKPGEWQTYDVIFTAPKFDDMGKATKKARMTVFQNGVLVQNNSEIYGETFNDKPAVYIAHPAKGPIKLQDHNNPTRFRNVWVRPL